MVVIPHDYFYEEKVVTLTQQQIEAIIEELSHAQHDIFTFLDYQKIIDRLKENNQSLNKSPKVSFIGENQPKPRSQEEQDKIMGRVDKVKVTKEIDNEVLNDYAKSVPSEQKEKI